MAHRLSHTAKLLRSGRRAKVVEAGDKPIEGVRVRITEAGRKAIEG